MAASQNLLLSDLEPLLDSLKVMTIATLWESGVWSAPVYYLYRERAFWFFSSPDSRHIMGSELSLNMMVAASIFLDDDDFSKIRSIQMRGQIKKSLTCAAISEVAAYIRKFKIPFKGADPLTFIQQQYRSSLYRFVPAEIIYMDNRIHIGFKQKITL